jgi:histidine triad (HIT) family protein
VPTSGPDRAGDCPFCAIINGIDPDVREIYRDEHVVAFFPSEPATLGHTLVVPRKHIRDIWSLTPDIAGPLAQATVVLAGAVKRAMNPDGLNVIQSNGEAATQTVMHLHVHLVPRWVHDKIGRIWPPETHYSEAQKDDAWEALRRECRSISA